MSLLKHLRFSALLFAMAFPTLVQAGFINGGFESGLTGWTASPSALVTTTSSFGSYGPQEGTSFALVESGEEDVFTVLSQTITASAGDVLTGKAFFRTTDYLPFDDEGDVRIQQNGAVLFSSSVSDVGDFGSTPWTSFSYVFTTSGSFTFEARVRNIGDDGVSSFLGLDDVKLTSVSGPAVPEPISVALWTVGATGLGFVVRRKRR